MDVRALRVEALVGVGGVVDHLELAVAVEEAVATLHVPLVVLLLVPELSVVAESKLIQGFHEDMRGYRCVGRWLRESYLPLTALNLPQTLCQEQLREYEG